MVEAYKNNDLRQMELLYEMASGEEVEVYEESIETLQVEVDRLEELLLKVAHEIEKVKSSYPYNEKDTLEDEGAIAIEKERLQNLLKEYKHKIKIYEAKIQAMEE